MKVNMILLVLLIAQPQFPSALGIAEANKLSNKSDNVIAVIGDGAISAGMAYEAMNNAGASKTKMIVILNDNDMSIARPVGAMSTYLLKFFLAKIYFSLRETIKLITSAFSKKDSALKKPVKQKIYLDRQLQEERCLAHLVFIISDQ